MNCGFYQSGNYLIGAGLPLGGLALSCEGLASIPEDLLFPERRAAKLGGTLLLDELLKSYSSTSPMPSTEQHTNPATVEISNGFSRCTWLKISALSRWAGVVHHVRRVDNRCMHIVDLYALCICSHCHSLVRLRTLCIHCAVLT
jgi:hypothetical protein